MSGLQDRQELLDAERDTRLPGAAIQAAAEALDREIAERMAAAPPIDAERAALLIARAHGRNPLRPGDQPTPLERKREWAAHGVKVPLHVWAALVRGRRVSVRRIPGGFGTSARLTAAGRRRLVALGEPS